MAETLIKNLIELSETVYEADGVIEEQAKITELTEKIVYVKNLFGISIRSHHGSKLNNEDARLRNDYFALLGCVITPPRRWQ
jgi:hypothetical protein